MPLDLNKPVRFTKCFQCNIYFRIPVVSGMFKCPRCGFQNKRRSELGGWKLKKSRAPKSNKEPLFEMTKRLSGSYGSGKKK